MCMEQCNAFGMLLCVWNTNVFEACSNMSVSGPAYYTVTPQIPLT